MTMIIVSGDLPNKTSHTDSTPNQKFLETFLTRHLALIQHPIRPTLKQRPRRDHRPTSTTGQEKIRGGGGGGGLASQIEEAAEESQSNNLDATLAYRLIPVVFCFLLLQKKKKYKD